MTINDYLNLITSAFRQKPNFISVISNNVSTSVQVQDLMLKTIPAYDLDLAVGSQLDDIGQWVGVSRNISVPISGVYFTWDSTDALGWDYGSWQDTTQPTNITSLPDDAYRSLIRAKIAANKWNGSVENAYVVWDQVFSTIRILIKDNQDMTYQLGFYGGTVDSLTLALILGGYIPLKPEGVRLSGTFTPANTGPLFAWDVESDFLAGWDSGSWVNEYIIS